MAKKRIPSTDELLKVALEAYRAAGESDSILVGGLAMQLYGSPRLTKDVDFASDLPGLESRTFKKTSPLTFGGHTYRHRSGIDVDWIVRQDDYQELYRDAVASTRHDVHGIPIITLEHLAAMKFAAQRPKDYEDLMYLLVHPDLNFDMARRLVYDHVGGQFAGEQFDAALEEARWRARRDRG